MGKLTELHAGSLVIIGHLHSKLMSLKAELFSALNHVDTREWCLENDHIQLWTQYELNDSLPNFSRDGLSLEMLRSGSQVIISHLQNQIRLLKTELSTLKQQCATNNDSQMDEINSIHNAADMNSSESLNCNEQSVCQCPCDKTEDIYLFKPEGG